MKYTLEIKPSCQKSIVKSCKKYPILKKAINKKVEQIVENPLNFKPLKHSLSGTRRVHIMKSFVLKYDLHENIITLLFFGHHDQAYKR